MKKYFLSGMVVLLTIALFGCSENSNDTNISEVKTCVSNGVSYFKEIGSYPTLTSEPNIGRSAEAVAKERCNQSPMAFSIPQVTLEFKGLKIGSSLAEAKSVIQNITCSPTGNSCLGNTTMAGVETNAELLFEEGKLMNIHLDFPDAGTAFMKVIDALKLKYGDTPMITKKNESFSGFEFTWNQPTGSIIASHVNFIAAGIKANAVNFVSNEILKKRAEAEQNIKNEEVLKSVKDSTDL